MSSIETRQVVKTLFAAVGIGVLAPLTLLSVPAEATYVNCPSGHTKAVNHYTGGQYRAKACSNGLSAFNFSDTHADGWGARFHYSATGSTNLYVDDTNGANNGWIYRYQGYGSGRTVYFAACSIDFSAGVDHGCTTSSYVVP